MFVSQMASGKKTMPTAGAMPNEEISHLALHVKKVPPLKYTRCMGKHALPEYASYTQRSCSVGKKKRTASNKGTDR